VKIIATVLEQKFSEAEERVERVKEKSRWIQVDVIDGIFAPGKSFELELLGRIENCDRVLWDIHLMVKEPIKWVEKCSFIDASRVIGQVEMMENREEFVDKVKGIGMEAGLAFDIDTEIGEIPKETDLVLLMGRKAGFESKDFEERVLEKVKEVVKRGFKVGVDGGINMENIDKLEEAGVEIAYCGGQFEKIYDEKNK